MFYDREICYFKLNFLIFRDTTFVRSYLDVFIDLTFPHKIKIELTAVFKHNFLRFSLINEKFAKIKFEWFTSLYFYTIGSCKYRMMDLISFSFYVKNKWASFSLHNTVQIVVVIEFIFRLEKYLNRNLRTCRDCAYQRSNFQGISIVNSSSNAFFCKVKTERNLFLIY